MVKLTRIYTGGGDQGETSLSDGTRIAKHDLRVDAYGTVDEANAVIGLARAEIARSGEGTDMDAALGRIQNDLFDVGADLCTPEGARPGVEPLRITAAQVARLEQEIDEANAALAPLNSFVLPGGGMLAAYLHHARTVVRRAERLVAQLAERETINAEAGIYLNRLSDLLFVLARAANDNGARDVLWVRGENR